METYYAAVCYKPLTLQQVERLHNIGAMAPYDQAKENFNIYFYVPTESYLDMKPKLESVTEFNIIKTPIPLAQIQKQFNKIEDVNSVKVGDTVYCKGYKKLPFTVNNVSGDKVHIFHTLKRSNLVLVVNKKQVHRADDTSDLPRYTRRQLETPSEKIYVDMDCYGNLNNSDFNQTVLRDLINIKLNFLDRKIVLLNPILKDTDLIYMLGLEQCYQPIGNVRGIVVTNTPLTQTFNLIDGYTKEYTYSNKDKFFFLYKAKRKNLSQITEAWNRYINNEPAYKDIVEDILKVTFSNTQEPVIIPQQETSIPELETKMIHCGCNNIHAKAEDIIYLLKGKL